MVEAALASSTGSWQAPAASALELDDALELMRSDEAEGRARAIALLRGGTIQGKSSQAADHSTTLLRACVSGNFDAAKLLLEEATTLSYNVDPNVQALWQDLRSGRLASSGVIVGDDIRTSPNALRNTSPLIASASIGHAGLVELLLRFGADPALRVSGQNALSACSSSMSGTNGAAASDHQRCHDLLQDATHRAVQHEAIHTTMDFSSTTHDYREDALRVPHEHENAGNVR